MEMRKKFERSRGDLKQRTVDVHMLQVTCLAASAIVTAHSMLPHLIYFVFASGSSRSVMRQRAGWTHGESTRGARKNADGSDQVSFRCCALWRFEYDC